MLLKLLKRSVDSTLWSPGTLMSVVLLICSVLYYLYENVSTVRCQVVMLSGVVHWYSGDTSLEPKDTAHGMNEDVRDL